MTTTPATDEHLERLRGRVSGEGQAIATSSEIRQVLARIDADRARIAELEAELADVVAYREYILVKNTDLRALNTEMTQALEVDDAGRTVPELLDVAAVTLDDIGGGPLSDCLRSAGARISDIIEKAKAARQ